MSMREACRGGGINDFRSSQKSNCGEVFPQAGSRVGKGRRDEENKLKDIFSVTELEVKCCFCKGDKEEDTKLQSFV